MPRQRIVGEKLRSAAMGFDVAKAIPMTSADEFDGWLRTHGATEREVVVAIYKKDSGRQTVSFSDLLEVAVCHGWIDTQSKGIDPDRYALRFTPRRSGSNWSATNRALARRLIAEGRMTEAGRAALPADL